MTETKEVKEPSGIAILPKNDKRPIAIVGMGSSDAEKDAVNQLSERLTQVGMVHVSLTLEEAKAEGITEEDLISAQLEQSQTDNLLEPNPIFNQPQSKVGGSKAQQKFKRKKKGKKTHRKKRK